MNSYVGNRRWGIVFLLALCYLVLFMDRSCMSMAGPAMMKYYNWTPSQFGLASTAFFIGYAIMQMPGGRLADRFGGGKVMVAGALWWGLFVYLTPYGPTLFAVMIIRMLMGLGEGVTMPAIHSTAARWYPKKEAGKAIGIVQIGCPAGIALTMILATWVLQTWNWQSVFHSFAFLAPLWCLVWWKYGKDRPDKDSRIKKAELEYILQDKTLDLAVHSGEQALTKKDIFLTPSVWCCALSYFCANYLFFLFMTWLPTYFVLGRGINLNQSAIYSMLPYLVAIFTYPLGGFFADAASKRFGQNIGRKLFPMVGLISAGVFLILGAHATSAGYAAALISASNGFLTLTMGGFFSMPVVFSDKNVGLITGIFTTLGTSAGILAPMITGFIVDYTGKYENALFTGAGVAMAGAIILMTICQVKPIIRKAGQAENLAAEH
ncbi:MAG: ACS family MFS transporter [Peptococcaceae bacterium]|nr:ACS family MFS transporter [Peptococcaceae bacterium]